MVDVTDVVARALVVGLATMAAGGLFPAIAGASPQSDRGEQLRYARETVNLSYSKFLSRKADFTDKGCNSDHPKRGGCKKPSPYNRFDWSADGCSPPTPPGPKQLFSGPCQLHDFGYRNFGKNLTLGHDEDTRAWIDGRFHTEMNRRCGTAYPLSPRSLATCLSVAEAMFAAVRNAPGNHWGFIEVGTPIPSLPTPIAPLPPIDLPEPLPELELVPVPSGPASVQLAQGPAAPSGFRYAISLSGFAAGSTVSISCRDSKDPGGFYTFTLVTDGAGNASTAGYCYSGDGPDHWVVANGIESNHASWGGAAPAPPAPAPAPPQTYGETTGGVAHTWTNYTNAGGSEGPTIAAHATIQIACKLTGFRVADGNTWWYRIASAPWNSAFYVSADAFYNNGATSGSLHGTPFVDANVRNC